MYPDILTFQVVPGRSERSPAYVDLGENALLIVDIADLPADRIKALRRAAANGTPTEAIRALDAYPEIAYALFVRDRGVWTKDRARNAQIERLATCGDLQVVFFDTREPVEPPEWFTELRASFEGPRLRELLGVAAGELTAAPPQPPVSADRGRTHSWPWLTVGFGATALVLFAVSVAGQWWLYSEMRASRRAPTEAASTRTLPVEPPAERYGPTVSQPVAAAQPREMAPSGQAPTPVGMKGAGMPGQMPLLPTAIAPQAAPPANSDLDAQAVRGSNSELQVPAAAPAGAAIPHTAGRHDPTQAPASSRGSTRKDKVGR